MKVKNWWQVPPDYPLTMRREIQTAPLSIAIGINDDFLRHRGGVVKLGDLSMCIEDAEA